MARLFRIGQIVPSSNTTMETEIPAMLRARENIRPERFSFHSSRMRMKRVTRDELAAMDAQSVRCAAIITPYLRPLTNLVAKYIEHAGVRIVDTIALEITDNLEVGELARPHPRAFQIVARACARSHRLRLPSVY